MKLKQLQEKRGSLVKEARQILDAAGTETRALTADEQTKLSGIEGEIDGLNTIIEAEMRQMARETQNPQFSQQEQRDLAKFSLAKVVLHADMVQRGMSRQLDGIEAEMIREGENEARSAGVNISGLAIPSFLMKGREERATLSVTGGTNQQYGGALVATEKYGVFGDFYNAGVLESAGALVLTGLVGNLDVPRYNKGSAPSKRTENQAAIDVGGTFTDLNLSPKRLAGFVEISDRLMMQTPEVIEAFVAREIRNHMIAVREKAFFHGGGTDEPVGIASTVGISPVIGGTNGAAPDWDDIIDLETKVAAEDALMGSLAYMTNAKVRGKLKRTAIESGDPAKIWDRLANATPLNGYPAAITNAIRSDITKAGGSNLSAIFFGNAADFVIGYWGGIMLEVTRDSTDAKAGKRTLVANTYYDAGVIRAQSFAAMLDAVTV